MTSAAHLARERVLPVDPALAPLFGTASEAGLVRGQTVACVGTAAVSCALALAVAPTRSGSWAGVVGMPQVGVAAAWHLGVVLERTAFVALPEAITSETRSDLVGALSALVDGVDLVIMARRLVVSLSPSVMRRLQARAQSRGAVLVVVGEPGAVPVDLRLSARSQSWHGIGSGHGHLHRRMVTLELDGRRCGRPRRRTVWLPGEQGGLSDVAPSEVPDLVDSASGVGDGAVVVPLRRLG